MNKSRDEELVHQSLDDENEGAFEILYHRYEMSLLIFSTDASAVGKPRKIWCKRRSSECMHTSAPFGIGKNFRVGCSV